MRCNQCEAAMINGVFCHETGCPNSRKTWLPGREEWVRLVECFDCGCEIEEGAPCDCHGFSDEEMEQMAQGEIC